MNVKADQRNSPKRGMVHVLSNKIGATRDVQAITIDGESQAPDVTDNSRKVELIISVVLRCGVLASSALIAIGSAAFLLSSRRTLEPATLSNNPSFGAASVGAFHSLSEVMHGLSSRDPNALVALGLLMLLVTPIIPVGLSAASFLLDRDRPYILITLSVLAILAASFFLGFAAS